MQYTDKITKTFLTYGSMNDKKSYVTDHQDPTYIGFNIRLKPAINNVQDYDNLPHGLFTLDPKNDPYSCYNYLKNRGETTRADYILEFEEAFKKIVNECPWYFLSISGLAECWKVDPGNSWRGKDKALTIDTLESIDLKMTYILDLYRKAIYDFNWMRYTTPDHMRWFKMDVIVSEIRDMNVGTKTLTNTAFGGYPIDINNTNLKRPDSTIIPSLPSANADSRAQQFANISNTPNIVKNPTTTDKGLYDNSAPWTNGTFIKFSFSECELAVLDSAPKFLDTVGNAYSTTPAGNSLIINTGIITESNTYGLLGAILEDTAIWSDYTKNKFAYPNSRAIDKNDPLPAPTIITSYTDGIIKRNKDTKKIVENSSKISLISEEIEKAKIDALKTDKSPLEKGVIGFFNDILNNKINKFILGNVNGISPSSIIGSAQSIINNPVAAIEAILKKHSSPQIGGAIAKNVGFTSAENKLVSDLIGVVKFVSPVINKNIEKNVNFVTYQNPPAKIARVKFDVVKVSNDIAKKVIFDVVPIPVSNIEKVKFEYPTFDPLTDTKVYLNSPPKRKARSQKTTLTSFASATTTVANVEFETFKTLEAKVDKVDLEIPFIPKTNQEKVDLIAPEISRSVLGKIVFNEVITKKPRLGKVILT